MRSQIHASGIAAGRVMARADTQPVLGIIAGGGRLPAQLVDACLSTGRPCFVLVLEGYGDASAFSHVPHATVRLGAVGESLKRLRKANVKELVLAGHVRRPPMSALRPDFTGTMLLARLGAAFFAGDDALLKALVSFFEDEGFKVIGVDEVLAGLVAPVGPLGKIIPDERARADIAQGIAAAKKLGELDIGQGVIVENGEILGSEAAEGTDALIERCAELGREKHRGVLVKMKKPSQDGRTDLPSIGPQTIEKLHAAGFAGVAVESGGALILDKEQTVERADALGLFVVGVTHG